MLLKTYSSSTEKIQSLAEHCLYDVEPLAGATNEASCVIYVGDSHASVQHVRHSVSVVGELVSLAC